MGPVLEQLTLVTHTQLWVRGIDPFAFLLNRSWQLFFEPVELRFETTDLLVELGLELRS
jgi:hypothetical protein